MNLKLILIILSLAINILRLFAESVPSFLETHCIVAQNMSTNEACLPIMSSKESLELGEFDGSMGNWNRTSLFIGFGSGLVLSLPGTIITSCIMSGANPKTVPTCADNSSYRKGYKSSSRAVNRNSALMGGISGSIIQLFIVYSMIFSSNDLVPSIGVPWW